VSAGAGTPYRPWAAAWAGFAALATINGVSRGLYLDRVGEARAHQLSTVTVLAALVPYTRIVEHQWPVPTARAAAGIGAGWVGLTVGFEFGFGHYLARQSWSTLRSDYDLRRGRLWPVVLLAVAVAPATARSARLGRRRHRRGAKLRQELRELPKPTVLSDTTESKSVAGTKKA
jgi:hypothetical protein